MQMRNYKENEIVLNFYSAAKNPFYNLSNFVMIPDGIEFEDEIYPSIEHAFQAQKYIKDQRKRFSTIGDLGTWEGIYSVFVLKNMDDYEKKYKYWSQKNNIGIIAKMATNIKIGKKLNLIRDPNFESTDELWLKLLEKKYSIKYFGDILKSTNDIYLLEYNMRALSNINNSNFWNGRIVNNKLYGNNQMGMYLMEIRKNQL